MLCGDLFTAFGNGPALTDGDIVGPAIEGEDPFRFSSLAPSTPAILEHLAGLAPHTLALMHGSSFDGDTTGALRRGGTKRPSLGSGGVSKGSATVELGVQHTFATDGDSVMLAVPGAEGQMVRTGPGSGEVRVTVVDLGAIQIARLQFGFPAVAEAVGVGDSVILCTMLRADGGTWEGVPLATGQTFAYGPGTTHHAADPAGLEFAMAVVPWNLFERAADDLGFDPRRAASKRTLVDGPWWPVAKALPFEPLASGDVALDATTIQDRVLDAAVRAACGGTPDRHGVGSGRRWSDADLVAAVIGFLDSNAQWHVPVLTLCREVGVSERRLHYAFRRMLDVSPGAFLYYRALQGAHVALLDADPSVGRVADIARAHGFTHLGRFASSHRAVYAELPSTTLNRSPSRCATSRRLGAR